MMALFLSDVGYLVGKGHSLREVLETVDALEVTVLVQKPAVG
jgi:hypothetical protein